MSKENATEMIMTLVNFGALLDYRTRDGLTPLHKAAVAGRAYSVKVCCIKSAILGGGRAVKCDHSLESC